MILLLLDVPEDRLMAYQHTRRDNFLTRAGVDKLFGAQRIALGSDYPFPLGEEVPGQVIESMKLSVQEKAQLLSGTAHEFLRL
jgi:hypothetical protein